MRSHIPDGSATVGWCNTLILANEQRVGSDISWQGRDLKDERQSCQKKLE
jgi:hypothetical protein